MRSRSLSAASAKTSTGRAPGKLARWLKKKLRVELGKAPRVPWLLAAVFVVLPLALLLRLAPATAAVLVVLLALLPIGYARLDR